MQRQHQTGKPQSWVSADHDIREFLEAVVEEVRELLKPEVCRTDGHAWNRDALLEFRDFVKEQNISR